MLAARWVPEARRCGAAPGQQCAGGSAGKAGTGGVAGAVAALPERRAPGARRVLVARAEGREELPTRGMAADAGPDGGDPNIIWQYLAPAGPAAYAVVVDSAHVIHVAGTDGSSSSGFHLRLDENGNVLGSADEPLSSYTYTYFSDLAIDAADNVYFVGTLNNGGSDTSAYVRWGGVGGTTWGHSETYSLGETTPTGPASSGSPITDSKAASWRVRPGVLRLLLSPHPPSLSPRWRVRLRLCRAHAVERLGVGGHLDGQDNIYVAGSEYHLEPGEREAPACSPSGRRPAADQSLSTPIPEQPDLHQLHPRHVARLRRLGRGSGSLGNDCDHGIILEEIRSDERRPLAQRRHEHGPGPYNLQTKLASDGTTLAFVGTGEWSAQGIGFQLTDTDLQGTPIRKFSLALTHGNSYDGLTGVAFLGHDRIVVGNTMAAASAASQIWVARIRAP